MLLLKCLHSAGLGIVCAHVVSRISVTACRTNLRYIQKVLHISAAVHDTTHTMHDAILTSDSGPRGRGHPMGPRVAQGQVWTHTVASVLSEQIGRAVRRRGQTRRVRIVDEVVMTADDWIRIRIIADVGTVDTVLGDAGVGDESLMSYVIGCETIILRSALRIARVVNSPWNHQNSDEITFTTNKIISRKTAKNGRDYKPSKI